MTAAYPNIAVVATTLRAVISATRNDWGAVGWADGDVLAGDQARRGSRSSTGWAAATRSPRV